MYYFTPDGWDQAAAGNPSADNIILYPDAYFTVRQPAAVADDTTWSVIGSVVEEDLRISLFTRPNGAQDNAVALTRPVDVTLAASGLDAPFYTLYGTVRDDQGQTLRMDMQRTGTAAYSDIANGPGDPFSLSIIIHNVAFQPIEVSQPKMVGNAGDRVRLDLTLGIDSDNDGLPDAWEQAQREPKAQHLPPYPIEQGDRETPENRIRGDGDEWHQRKPPHDLQRPKQPGPGNVEDLA